MVHAWQVIRSHLASAGLPLTLWLAIVVYAVSHLLPVMWLFGQWIFGWQASMASFEMAADAVWHAKSDWQVVLVAFGWLPNLWFWLGVACWVVRRRRNQRLAGVGTGLAGLAGIACASVWLTDADSLSIGYYGWLTSMALLSWSGLWAAAKTEPSPQKR